MFIDLTAGTPSSLVVAAVAVYAACLLHLVAKDSERARWQRQFGGWRALQRDRINDRAGTGLRFPLLRLLRRPLACPPARPHAAGWTALQRQRLTRRRA